MLTQERTVQSGIPEQYHEDSDTLLRLSGIEYTTTTENISTMFHGLDAKSSTDCTSTY